MLRLLLLPMIFCLCAVDVRAQDTQSPVADLIKVLSSKDAKKADTARDQLIALGDKAVNELEGHETDDPAVAARIKYALNRICNYYIRMDPKREKSIGSTPYNGVEVMMTIKNNTNGTVKMHWLTAGRERVPYKEVKPGQQIVQRSFEGHCWVVTGKDSKALGIYRATYQNGRILVNQKFF